MTPSVLNDSQPLAESIMTHFLGLDGGGSHTRAVLVDQRLEVLGRSKAGPSNYLRVGIVAATKALTEAVLDALKESGRDVSDVEWAYCGIAGSDHPVHRDVLVKAMKSIFEKGNFTVDTDARIALEGAVGEGAGIVVISGTGSVAFGRNEAGEEARAGGWGPTLGDEGSGYAIAREGMTAIVRAADGRGPQTTMTDVLCRLYGICSPADLRYVIYSEESDASRIAKLNRVVVEAAREGDEIASVILEEAGSELALSVLAVARSLRMTGEPFNVSYAGGAFEAGELLLEPFRRTLLERAPECRVAPPRAEPVIGAAQLAIQTWQQGGRERTRVAERS